MILSESAHCAIIIVIELIKHYQRKGVSCKEISLSQHIPLSHVESIAKTLEELGLVSFIDLHSGENVLYLTRDPETLMFEDVIKAFDRRPFSGVFIDDTTGNILPQSCLTKLINKERQYVYKYLMKHYRKINLAEWAECINNERRFS